MRYDLVILDLDGTLVDSFPFFLRAHNRLARAHGFRPIHDEEVEALRHRSARDILSHVGLRRWRLPLVARDFIRLMRSEGRDIPLFEGVASALLHLQGSGIRLAVVTSNSVENARRLLGDELCKAIAHIDGGASLFGKAARIRRTVRRLGVRPHRTIYVGDQITDAEAAQAAGVDFGAVAWGYAAIAALIGAWPDVVFHRVDDLRHLATDRRAAMDRLPDALAGGERA